MTKVTADVIAVLAALPYLACVPRGELERLAAHCAWRSVTRGGTVFREGDAARGLFVIVEGRVKLSRLSPAGREQVLHVEGAGVSLAEVPVFDGGGYVGTAVALTDARVLFVERPALLALCRRRPDVALGVIAGVPLTHTVGEDRPHRPRRPPHPPPRHPAPPRSGRRRHVAGKAVGQPLR